MSVKDFLRRVFRRWGYSAYRSKALPVGLDLVADLSRIKDVASMQVVYLWGRRGTSCTRMCCTCI